MKNITKLTRLASGSVLLAGLAGVVPGLESLTESVLAEAPELKVLTLEVAADCRTFVNGPNRADVAFGSGKIFPARTLPSGTADNDPTQPLNGVAPIGDWTTNGQNAFPFPPAIASSYSSTPAFFATQYYILSDGRALTVQGFAFLPTLESFFSVTGGIGAFRGAAGDLHGSTVLGTNATGCPNFRAKFRLQSGARHNGSN